MTVDAIKAAIEQLPDPDRRELADWMEEQAQQAWDMQMQRDFSDGGRGHDLFEKVNRDIDEGQFNVMDFGVRGPQAH